MVRPILVRMNSSTKGKLNKSTKEGAKECIEEKNLSGVTPTNNEKTKSLLVKKSDISQAKDMKNVPDRIPDYDATTRVNTTQTSQTQNAMSNKNILRKDLTVTDAQVSYMKSYRRQSSHTMEALLEQSNQLDVGPRLVSDTLDPFESTLLKHEEAKIRKMNEKKSAVTKPTSNLLQQPFKNFDLKPRVIVPQVNSMSHQANAFNAVQPSRPNSAFATKNIFVNRFNNNMPLVNLCPNNSLQLNNVAPANMILGPGKAQEMEVYAYMKSIQDQAIRKHQDLLKQDPGLAYRPVLKQPYQSALKQLPPNKAFLNFRMNGAAANCAASAILPIGFINPSIPHMPIQSPQIIPPAVPTATENILPIPAPLPRSKITVNKRGRPKRDPREGWPKRPLSAYNIFFKDIRQEIVGSEEDTPIFDCFGHCLKPHSRRRRRKKHGKISFGGLAKAVGAMWKQLSPEKVAYYNGKAEESREAYRKEIQLFLQKRTAAQRGPQV